MSSEEAQQSSRRLVGPVSRRDAIAIALLTVAVSGHCNQGICSATEPQRIGGEVQLFVDDHLIAVQNGLTRVHHPAEKLARPVLEPDQPWEKGRVYLYGTVLRDGQENGFRMWYGGGGAALAVSVDGIRWTKPKLGLISKSGQDTNILMTSQGSLSVVRDSREPDPAKRYKGIGWVGGHRRGFNAYMSPDGVHWTAAANNPVIPYGSEVGQLSLDEDGTRYLAYLRPFLPRHHPRSENQKRLGSVTTSVDFSNWTEQSIVLRPDEVDDGWVEEPDQRTEFYAMNGFRYGSQYLGIIPVFRVTRIHERIEPLQSKYDGPIHAELIHSRDGVDWARTSPRTHVIPNGPHEYDRGCIMNVANQPIIVGDEVWHYYTGINTTHGGPLPPKRITIALAKWRLDGYASLEAGSKGGDLTTKPILIESAELFVNADAVDGELLVEVLDGEGQILEGYDRDNCIPIRRDDVRQRVKWRGNENLPLNQPVSLRFLLQNASIYSYKLGQPDRAEILQ